MTLGSHNFVKFTVKKLNCQKHSGCAFASGKNAMYPFETKIKIKLIFETIKNQNKYVHKQSLRNQTDKRTFANIIE